MVTLGGFWLNEFALLTDTVHMKILPSCETRTKVALIHCVDFTATLRGRHGGVLVGSKKPLSYFTGEESWTSRGKITLTGSRVIPRVRVNSPDSWAPSQPDLVFRVIPLCLIIHWQVLWPLGVPEPHSHRCKMKEVEWKWWQRSHSYRSHSPASWRCLLNHLPPFALMHSQRDAASHSDLLIQWSWTEIV